LEAGSPFKAAYSKALKDACKKWGIGLYLEEEDQSSFSPPITNTNPVVDKSNVPPISKPTVTPSIPSTTSTQSIPHSTSMPTFPTQSVQTPPAQPRTVIIPTPTQPVTESSTQIPFAVPETPNAGPSGISDIQKVALGGIITSKGIAFEELAKEAFTAHSIVKDPFPSRDDLTYDEAVLIIKYGNDKFRKQ